MQIFKKELREQTGEICAGIMNFLTIKIFFENQLIISQLREL